MLENKLAYIITGAPGSGKTSIMNELSLRGFQFIEEPARAIIAEQRAINGEGLYDRDTRLFKELILSRAINEFKNAHRKEEVIFFDRGIPDVIAYTHCFKLPLGSEVNAAKEYWYNKTVFFAPSWREIFTNDEDRKLTFEQTEDFGNDLKKAYEEQGYNIVILPCISPKERAEFIINLI